MKKQAWVSFLMVLCLLAGLTGCEKGIGEKDLVKVNDVSISLEEFRQVSERQPLEGKMRLLSEKAMRDFLENYVITREVLYQEARRKGIDKNKEIVAKVEDFKRAMVIDALLEESLKGRNEVSDREIEEYYKGNQELFTEPLEVRIRHIVVSSEPSLRDVLSRLSRGEGFETLAREYNMGGTGTDGGDLGYIRRGQLSPPFAQFEEAAFSLKNKGDISEIVKTPYGYHLLQLEDKRGTNIRPLSQVKEKIRAFLLAKKKQDTYLSYVKELKGKSKITINEKLWAQEEMKELKPKEEKGSGQKPEGQETGEPRESKKTGGEKPEAEKQ